MLVRSADHQAPALDAAYRSLFAVGRGGMGSVDIALERGADGVERIVALKRLLPESARDPRRKEMFLREAKLAALLTHPNVVRAFAVGEVRDELFLAMEYVEGQPLSEVIEAAAAASEPLDPALVAHLLAEVCEGLHAAHELRDVRGRRLGVVHRDMSPRNVMVAYDGRVKILDFGVAKVESATHHTRTGEVKGTMVYMSPEQALGEPLDQRSDLFSVGAVLFECLVGRPMWGRGTDVEIMRRLALEEPPPLGECAPCAPRDLADLHARLISRDRNRRPATARDVAAELHRAAGAVNESHVRALMARLFAAEAEERRARLSEALERAAPGDALPGDALTPGDVQSPVDATSSNGVATPRPMLAEPAPPHVRPHRTMAGGVLVAALIAAFASGAGIATSARPADRQTRPAADARSPGITSEWTPAHRSTSALDTASGLAPVPASPPTPVLASVPAPASAPTSPPPPAAAAEAAPRRPRSAPAAATHSTLPDVDPTPF